MDREGTKKVSKFEFKTEDFPIDAHDFTKSPAEQARDFANALLDAHREKCQRVWAVQPNPRTQQVWSTLHSCTLDTHTALLFDLEEVK